MGKTTIQSQQHHNQWLWLTVLALAVLAAIVYSHFIFGSNYIVGRAEAASCPIDVSTGSATMNFTVDSANTGNSHTIWSRIMVPAATNSYYLKLDGNCYKVGGINLPINKWTWVKYQDANPNSIMNTTFASGGTHSASLIGVESSVRVDSVLMLTSNCDPSTGDGLGTACTTTPPSPSPSLSVQPSASVVPSVSLKPSVSTVTPRPSVSTPPQLSVPTPPANLVATAIFDRGLIVGWGASQPSTGNTIKTYNVKLNGNYIASTTVVGFSFTGLTPNKKYTVSVSAVDSAGKESSATTQNFTTKNWCFLFWCF